MRLEAITWERLTEELADRTVSLTTRDGSPWPRVLVDGAPAADPGALATALAAAVRLRGREALTVAAGGFWRPASLRLEYGRHDPDAYYERWLDTGALWREVFAPLEPGGSGEVLPDLWDPVRDRATRSPRVRLPPGGVLLLHGPLLLGHWFPADLVVHLSLSPGALARRTAPEEQWMLPAFARYETEVAPADVAHVLVRADDSRRPAWNNPPRAHR
ncbi:uridine kinase [Streptomyces sp. 7-21]|uniref:uridine kinase n=1 Tax=Streptomyces sp. 7-21 TaxID=2802283 RepID=UPI00191EDCAB|nr:uridine kinase [Streptomyces sp. 7-21]MBL1069068.1 uridine kinase [Streptomyces sp. 7-21]